MSGAIYCSLHAGLVIDGSNDALVLDEAGTTHTVSLAHGTWYVKGDGSVDDLLAMIASQLSASFAGGNVYAMTVTNDGSTPSWDINPANRHAIVDLRLTAGAINFRVKWADPASTFATLLNAAIGTFVTKGAANTAAEQSTTSPTAVWVPNEVYRQRRKPKTWEITEAMTADGDASVVRRSSKQRTDVIEFQLLNAARVFIPTGEPTLSGEAATALENFIDLWNDGRPLELHERGVVSGTIIAAVSSSTLVGVAFRLGKAMAQLDPVLVQPGLPLYNLNLTLVGATSNQ